MQRVAREVNEEFATEGWLPVHLEVRDDYARSLAAYSLADVLLVNPLRDGMNLVAKEYVAAQDPDDPGVLILSLLAGAALEMKEALLVNPHDLDGVADALDDLRSGRLTGAAVVVP